SPVGISDDGKNIIYSVTEFQVETEERTTQHYRVPVQGGNPVEIQNPSEFITDKSVSPDGTRKIEVEKVKLDKVLGKDYYPEFENSNLYIYNDLYYRHWDKWNDGTYNHLILNMNGDTEVEGIDIMKDEPFHSPQMPFGGSSDYT